MFTPAGKQKKRYAVADRFSLFFLFFFWYWGGGRGAAYQAFANLKNQAQLQKRSVCVGGAGGEEQDREFWYQLLSPCWDMVNQVGQNFKEVHILGIDDCMATFPAVDFPLS